MANLGIHNDFNTSSFKIFMDEPVDQENVLPQRNKTSAGIKTRNNFTFSKGIKGTKPKTEIISKQVRLQEFRLQQSKYLHEPGSSLLPLDQINIDDP
eukprot:CAMPEP_0202966138 /NCGR_PEP_ID=MMETSP1396-20130829/10411_1 /ASSEMBLY_ACC=CAM_ASM_000872 /TAXON_ID= /ORGANISM="Pseudokeronopsis sp., Strain Brazil" /LENGTH=96 /DNA_ID=CAMNT_0049689635 /DNA_START=30 /DNA_END=320 /DNA_ORIENTATION=+